MDDIEDGGGGTTAYEVIRTAKIKGVGENGMADRKRTEANASTAQDILLLRR